MDGKHKLEIVVPYAADAVEATWQWRNGRCVRNGVVSYPTDEPDSGGHQAVHSALLDAHDCFWAWEQDQPTEIPE